MLYGDSGDSRLCSINSRLFLDSISQVDLDRDQCFGIDPQLGLSADPEPSSNIKADLRRLPRARIEDGNIDLSLHSLPDRHAVSCLGT